MKTFEVKTGVGYIKDKDGNIISKYDLPPGIHPIKDDFTAHEVSSQDELDSITVYVSPLSPSEVWENKIRIETNLILREQAIASLIAKGEIE